MLGNHTLMKMRNSLFALLSTLAVVAVSCQKEVDYQDLGGDNPGTGNPGTGNPSNNSIIGDWKFKKLIVDMQQTIEFSAGGLTQKMISDMDLVSSNEAGTVKIDASTMVSTGITCASTSNVFIKTYVNGALVDQTTAPYSLQIPPSDGTVNYTKISNDSLAVQSSLIDIDYPGASTGMPTGLKVSWLGDTLVLTSRIKQEQIDNSLGIPAKSTLDATQIMKLTKN